MFTPSGELAGEGYSGNGADINQIADIGVRDHGPLPFGLYAIQPPCSDPKLGQYVLRLTPDPSNDMLGRGGFAIHGDNPAANETASEGCIILNRIVRARIWQSGFTCLRVVPSMVGSGSPDVTGDIGLV